MPAVGLNDDGTDEAPCPDGVGPGPPHGRWMFFFAGLLDKGAALVILI